MLSFNSIIIQPTSLLSLEARREAFLNLIRTINLRQTEDYDCTSQKIWSYRKGDDVRDGVNVRFGNMINGYPFPIAGIPFINSECGYIVGAYSMNDGNCIRIQKLISKETNGQLAKRIYRHRSDYTRYMRKDFNSYNVQWMLYVVWQKSRWNYHFGNLLKQIPVDAHIVENTTLHHGESATFWGAKNEELMSAQHKVGKMVNIEDFKTKKAYREAVTASSNEINQIGNFKGVNLMGKIIKLCSLSLIYGQEPPIDYAWLASKQLFLLGKRLEFPVVNNDPRMMLFIKNARG
jgi:hypothetical protein